MTLTLSALYLHPLKSAAALPVERALVSETGLQYDREWMVVDDRGEFLSQREQPRLALVRCELRHSELVLRAPGMIPLHLQLDGAEGECTVEVWGDALPAFDMGGLASQWISDFLGVRGLRLAAFDSAAQRLSDPQWSGGVEARNAFSDGFPLLVMSEASLNAPGGLNERLQQRGHPVVGPERLRPNLLIEGFEFPHEEDTVDALRIHTDEGPVVLRLTKPCPRCSIPDVNPLTAVLEPWVGDVLRSYRQHPRLQGAVAFGMNAVIVEGLGRTLRVGQLVEPC